MMGSLLNQFRYRPTDFVQKQKITINASTETMLSDRIVDFLVAQGVPRARDRQQNIVQQISLNIITIDQFRFNHYIPPTNNHQNPIEII